MESALRHFENLSAARDAAKFFENKAAQRFRVIVVKITGNFFFEIFHAVSCIYIVGVIVYFNNLFLLF